MVSVRSAMKRKREARRVAHLRCSLYYKPHYVSWQFSVVYCHFAAWFSSWEMYYLLVLGGTIYWYCIFFLFFSVHRHRQWLHDKKCKKICWVESWRMSQAIYWIKSLYTKKWHYAKHCLLLTYLITLLKTCILYNTTLVWIHLFALKYNIYLSIFVLGVGSPHQYFFRGLQIL